MKDFESCGEDEREKVRQLRQKLSQNYEHLERCTRDNARLPDELVEKSREVNAVRRAASVTQHQTSNMRNHFHQHGTSPPVSQILLGTSSSQQGPRGSPQGMFQVLKSQRGIPSQIANEVPLPRQMLFDGNSSWDSFIKSFTSLSASCGWSQEEKVFRLTNSLHDEPAEYAFGYLPSGSLQSFNALVAALEVRFKERSPMTSYLAQLEGRKLQSREKVSEFLKLVYKSYPPADDGTRETIGVHHFLKGLPDQQTAVAVGMKDPQTLEEAHAALETWKIAVSEMILEDHQGQEWLLLSMTKKLSL